MIDVNSSPLAGEQDSLGAEAVVEPSGACLPDGFMFDALGEPRLRFVRVILDGATMVLHPGEVAQFKQDEPDGGHVFKDVYLSVREFDDLPEFDGF